jgi:hypothetical protein
LLRHVRRLCATPLASSAHAELLILDRDSPERVMLAPAVVNPPSGAWSVRYHLLSQRTRVGALREARQLIDPRSRWCLVLDDRTTPVLEHADHVLDALDDWEAAVGVVAADVYEKLPGQRARRGRGGLPEVVRGCAYAIRSDALACFDDMSTDLHGFASELDLSAAAMRAGYRTAFDARLLAIRGVPEPASDTRHLGRWLMDRLRFVHASAPESERAEAIALMLRIALRRSGRWIGEHEFADWERHVEDRLAQAPAPLRPALGRDQWDRLTGLASARDAIAAHVARGRTRIAIIQEGDDAPLIQRALREAGATLVSPDDRPHAMVLGTLEPGVLLDAMLRLGDKKRGAAIIAPWTPPMPAPTLVRTPRRAAA